MGSNNYIITTQDIVKQDYHTTLNAVRCTTLTKFIIKVLVVAGNTVKGFFPGKTLLLNEYNETYLLNLKNQSENKTLPDIILISIIRDEPAGNSGQPFEGVKEVTYHGTPDGAIIKDPNGEKKYEVKIQQRDLLVSFKCFSKSDPLAYKLMKTLEQNLYYLRKLFGKYGLKLFSYGMPLNNAVENDNIDKVLGLSYKKLIFYFKVQDVLLMPIDAYLDDITIDPITEDIDTSIENEIN